MDDLLAAEEEGRPWAARVAHDLGALLVGGGGGQGAAQGLDAPEPMTGRA